MFLWEKPRENPAIHKIHQLRVILKSSATTLVKKKIEFSTFSFKGCSNPLKANFQGHASYKKIQVKQAIK